ncbi:MAG: thioesterase family protein, partial [Pseudomonadota bacterium]
EVRDASALIYQQLDHGDGTPCAAYRTWVDHIDTETGRLFSWSARTRAALESHIVEPPEKLAPRSIDPTAPVRGSATMADADTVGAPVLGNGVVSGDQCDLFGWMKAEMYIARISDAVPNLMAAWRENVAAAARAKGEEVTSGAAVLEYRLRYRKWPKAGDRVQVRSTLGDCSDKILSFVHWVIDPDSGEAWCTTEAVAVTFDLNTRKVITAPPQHMEALRALAPTGLTV